MRDESTPQMEQTEQRRQSDGSHGVTNETDATDDSALCARVPTIQEAVRLSLTQGITENIMFKYARAIRAFEVTTRKTITQPEVSNVFAEWWRTAQAQKILPDDASFDEYALLFEDTFPRARVPLGENALDTASKRAENAPMPEAAKQFSDPKMQKLVGVCFQLQKLAGSSPFFLSVRSCAKIYGTTRPETASAILNGFLRRGILKLHKKGVRGGNLASRFWFGDTKSETPGQATNKVRIAIPTFEPVGGGQFRREYEAMICDAKADLKKARAEPKLHERVLKKEVAALCKFLRDEAEKKPEKSAGNLQRATDEEKKPANYCSGKLTEQGKEVVTAWENRIEEIRNVMNGVKP